MKLLLKYANDTEENRALNRRVDFLITAMKNEGRCKKKSNQK